MGRISRKRKIAVLLGLVISIAVILLVSLPLWFPWVLPSILKHYGVGYSRYERDGYTRLLLRDVHFSKPNAKFQAAQIEVLFPTTFLWRNFTDDRSENYLRVSDWSLEFPKSKNPKKGTNSVFHTSKKIDVVLEELNRWIPKAALDKGKMRFQNQEISIPVAEWSNGNLSGRISSEKLFPETFFNAQLSRKPPKAILIETPAWNFGGELVVAQEQLDFLQIDGALLWQNNRTHLNARFGRDGWLPESASVKSDSFRVPPQIFKLEGYRELTGSLDFQWNTNRFDLDLTGRAQPSQAKEIFLSPLAAAIHATGDTNSVRIEKADISSPWLAAHLSKNVEFNFRGQMLSETATLKVAANLAGQSWVSATGQLEGEAILRRGKNRFPDTTFKLAGSGLGAEEVEINRLDVRGELNWPWLQLDSANVQFKDGANAQVNLNFNAVAREISDGKLQLDGSIGHKFLPPEISYKNISLTADVSGPIKNLSHSVHAEIKDAKFPDLTPLQLVADWRGTQFDFSMFRITAASENSSLSAGGAVKFATDQIAARINELALQKGEATILSLEKPFAVSTTKIGGEKSNWAITLEPFRWHGNETELSLAGKIQWPEQGNFSIVAQQVSLSRFRDFLERPPPEVFLDKMDASASWTNGPATFALSGRGRFFSNDGSPFSGELRVGGNAKGITVESANAGTATESIIAGKGFLPIQIVPGNRSNLVQLLPEQRIDFHAETIPNTQFWEQLAVWMQTSFRDPRVSLSLAGTFAAPEGKLTASAKEILIKPKHPDEPVPRLQNLFADFELAREKITLDRLEIFVENQPVRASGELPLPKNPQTDWREIFDWRKANAQLKIVDAQIAPFERLFPKILSPLGTVNLDLAITQGKLNGELRVADAALRPIPSLGPVHDITARMKFLDENITLETFEGNLGGQPVNLTGEINLAKRGTNGLPDFNFKLRGTNVPLSRSPELILRSDLDLAFVNDQKGEPLVSGALNLRDSFYLSDLKLLVPGKVAKPKQRPPYFSVEAEPFAKWRLDVAVRGTNFLKVRSPIFRGELSSNLKLEGTLKTPLALGDAKINSGVVQFPFANLSVDQGYISLTSENPYRPQLLLAASARTYGYDVKMDVHGFADQPVIEFSSNPGLTSEQILLMVTAGELPRDELTFSTQQKAGRLAFFLGKNLISKFGTTEARDDKLQIRSGENVSEQGRQTYYIEYKLTDDWSIIGEYDRFGALNAGFKWKFFEK